MTALHPAFAERSVRPAGTDLASLRADYSRFADEVGGEPQPVAEAREVEIPGPAGPVRARLYEPQEAAQGVLIYFHGGGWVLGDLDGIDRVCRSLSVASGARVLSVDYRLAPEHPFPAGVEDAEAAVRWADTELGGPLAVGGDSAGGNLAAVVARRARDAGGPALALQVLVYPVTDLRIEERSYGESEVDGLLNAADMRMFRDAYLAGADAADPDVSPLCAGDLSGLPPAFVAIAGHDVLRDEGEEYAARLRDAGVPVTLEEYPDMAHGFIRWGGVLDAARDLHARGGAAVRAALSD